MKTSIPNGRKILLAAALAMPLFALGAADDMEMMGPEHGPGALPGPMAFGEHGPRGPGRDGPGRPPWLAGLALSEAQEDKIFAILHEQAPSLREQMRAAAKARGALHALADSDQYDDAKAAALAKEVASAEAGLALQHARTQQKLRAVLTPEQRKLQAEHPPLHPARP